MADILLDIDNAFAMDPTINELGIMMTSPPPNIDIVDHKMGLSCKILKPLFSYTIKDFHLILKDIKYGTKSLGDNTVIHDIMRLTRAILIIKGDMPMAYNLRKQILLLSNNKVIDIDIELFFLSFLFTNHPKSPSSWEHRRWCLLQKCINSNKTIIDLSPGIFTTNSTDLKDFSMVIDSNNELLLCSNMSEKYPKNYYSWMHRLWLLKYMNVTELENELIFTKEWLISHVSDHCASNHRVQVILKILDKISSSNEYSINNNSNNHGSTREYHQKLQAFLVKISRILDIKIEPNSTYCTTDDNKNKDKKNKTTKINESSNTSNSTNFDIFTAISTKNTNDNHKTDNILDSTSLYYIICIEYFLKESKEIIVYRPGYETLWYHRRDVADLFLKEMSSLISDIILKLSQSNSNDCLNKCENEYNSGSNGTSRIYVKDDYIVDLSKNNDSTIDQSSSNKDNKNDSKNKHYKNDNNNSDANNKTDKIDIHKSPEILLSINDNSKILQQLVDLYSGKSYNDDTIIQFCYFLVSYILSWLKEEKNFVQYCTNENSRWDNKIHRQMSLRYYCFMLSRTTYWLNFLSIILIRKNVIDNTSKGNDIYHSKNNLENTKEIIINEFDIKTQPLDNAINSLNNYIKDLLICIKESLSHISNQLLQEGSMKYFFFIFHFYFFISSYVILWYYLSAFSCSDYSIFHQTDYCIYIIIINVLLILCISLIFVI